MAEGISDVGGSCFGDSKSVVAVMLGSISLFCDMHQVFQDSSMSPVFVL